MDTQKDKFELSIGLHNWVQLDERDTHKIRRDTAVVFLKPDDKGLTILWQKEDGCIFYSFRKYAKCSIKKIFVEAMYNPNLRGMTTPQKANNMLQSGIECIITIYEIEQAQSHSTSILSTHESIDPVSPDSQS